MSNSRTEKLIKAVLNGDSLENFKPQSRIEAILKNCCDRCGCDGLPTPRSRNEALLYRLAEQLADGGGGGGGVDRSVLYGLIDRTLSEFHDENITAVGAYGFAWCKIETFDAPNLLSIDYNGFYDCTHLEWINIPKVQSLGSEAFNLCSALKLVDLPSVTKIPYYCFYGATHLTTLILRANEVCELEDLSPFGQTPINIASSGAGHVYVPSSLVDEYNAHEVWSRLPKPIRAIEDYPEITGG